MKIPEQAGDDLSRAAQVRRDALMRQRQDIRAGQAALFQQERREAAVQLAVEELVHQPHHLGKARRHQLVGIAGHSRGLLHKRFVNIRRDAEHIGRLLRGDHHVKLDAAHNAGGGKQADIAFKQAVQRQLLALAGQGVGAQPSLDDDEQPRAVAAARVQDIAGLKARAGNGALQQVALRVGQFRPEREILLDRHSRSPPESVKRKTGPSRPVFAVWCTRGELNPYLLRDQNLNLARMPISPRVRIRFQYTRKKRICRSKRARALENRIKIMQFPVPNGWALCYTKSV